MEKISRFPKLILSLVMSLALSLVLLAPSPASASGPVDPGYHRHGPAARDHGPSKRHHRPRPRQRKVSHVEEKSVIVIQPQQPAPPVVERSVSISLGTEQGVSVNVQKTVIK